MTTDLFTLPYLEYDDLGLRTVRCMASGKPIKSRMEIPSKTNPKAFVYAISKHPNYREIPALVSDGTVVFLMVSDEFENIEITPEEAQRITQQIEDGKRAEMKASGRASFYIDSVLDRMKNKKVIRIMSPSEIKEKFGGLKHAS